MPRIISRSYLILQLALAAFPSQVFADPCPAGKLILWEGGYLHGSNIFQGRNPEGGPNGFGDGAFTQLDYDDLAEAGANFIQISHAGVFEEHSPYALDAAAEENLDRVIQRATQAGLYIGIAFRSGPGRNEAAISNRGGAVYESIWKSAAAQSAWVSMVRHVADRYKGNPHIVGYSVMVEPNAYAQFGYPSPQDFYATYRGTLKDVNGLYALATSAIRGVDSDTPILLEPEGYGGITWLPYLTITGDTNTVYTPHDYSPAEYAAETVPGSTYPGTYDIDGDGNNEFVNATSLSTFVGSVHSFSVANHVPVAITEFGVHRTAPGAAQYLSDRISIQNPIGSWAVWTWQPTGFDDRFNMHDAPALLDVLRTSWTGNCRPNFEGSPSSDPSATIQGRAYALSSKKRAGKPLSGITVRVGSHRKKTSRRKPTGSYSISVAAGSYRMKASADGFSCTIGLKKKVRRISLSAAQTLYVNVFCRRG